MVARPLDPDLPVLDAPVAPGRRPRRAEIGTIERIREGRAEDRGVALRRRRRRKGGDRGDERDCDEGTRETHRADRLRDFRGGDKPSTGPSQTPAFVLQSCAMSAEAERQIEDPFVGRVFENRYRVVEKL